MRVHARRERLVGGEMKQRTTLLFYRDLRAYYLGLLTIIVAAQTEGGDRYQERVVEHGTSESPGGQQIGGAGVDRSPTLSSANQTDANDVRVASGSVVSTQLQGVPLSVKSTEQPNPPVTLTAQLQPVQESTSTRPYDGETRSPRPLLGNQKDEAPRPHTPHRKKVRFDIIYIIYI